jgi:hypothetical protein
VGIDRLWINGYRRQRDGSRCVEQQDGAKTEKKGLQISGRALSLGAFSEASLAEKRSGWLGANDLRHPAEGNVDDGQIV